MSIYIGYLFIIHTIPDTQEKMSDVSSGHIKIKVLFDTLGLCYLIRIHKTAVRSGYNCKFTKYHLSLISLSKLRRHVLLATGKHHSQNNGMHVNAKIF